MLSTETSQGTWRIRRLNYQTFLKTKRLRTDPKGFDPIWLPDWLFGFQNHLCDWSIRLGRSALYEDCGLGKGSPPNMPVLTPTGFVPIGSLEIGDSVIASDGKSYDVKGVYFKPRQDVFRLWFSDGVSLVVDSDHLHICRTNNDRQRDKPWRVLSTKELLECNNLRYGSDGKSRNYDIPVVGPVEFSVDCPKTLTPYIIGALLGDGCTSQPSMIQFTSADSEIVNRINNELLGGVELVYKDRYEYRLKTGKTGCVKHPIRAFLYRIGMMGKLSYQKSIPKEYLMSKRIEDRLDLLRGLMDTDGYIMKCGTSQFYSVSRKLATDVEFLVRSLGGVPTFSRKQTSLNGERKRDCYTVTFSLKTFNPFFLSRKAERWNPDPRDNGRWIDSIDYEGQSETVCISVDSPDSSYVTRSFIVTHNTPQQLVWAENVVRHTNKPVLIVAPLAVSAQFVTEAEKFGVGIHRSRDGRLKKGINVTNYERLHHFDPKRLAGISCDECFPPGTAIDVVNPLDNSLEKKYIEDIARGDQILNASGVDHVKHIWKRKINGAVQVGTEGSKITCSENHPFFTLHGWKFARDLRAGDCVMETASAMYLVRGDFQSEICSEQDGEILRNILLSEMADEYTGTQSKSTQSNCCQKKRKIESIMVQRRISNSQKRTQADSRVVSDERSESESEGVQTIERDRTQAEDSGREWETFDGAATDAIRFVGWGVGCRISNYPWEKDTRISNELQGRYRLPITKNSNRVGWAFSLFQKRIGSEERRNAGFVRVDSVEVLELGHPRLDKWRDEKGDVYFYDIEATRHPSFSVNGLLVHNSSILKNFDGKMRRRITDFVSSINYRLLCTATPAPNDHMELGTSSEALGVMSRGQMLGMFFVNGGETTQQWLLKGHAKKRFWQWMGTWARAIRMPSDLGFDDGDFILPELIMKQHLVPSEVTDGFFPTMAVTLDEQRAERKRTMQARCEKVAEIVPNDRPFVAWCHLNPESDLLEKLIPDAVQVSGSMKDEVKEERLKAFADGQIRVLVTKPKIASFGLNWQHCADMSFFPSHSHEQFYQSLRRCYRFQQENSVTCNIVTSEAESRVLDNMMRKERQAVEMYDGIVREMGRALDESNGQKGNEETSIPSWL
ncbi:hypothetical protein LCGC14_0248460 [marine sediment metagenome]|uniref:DOD-type homing endonuclease domain-containing protein n=1 Tax=marine sediment metagenome TaxID=412755 RepID=A0A0F9U9L8_9ZZZZ